MAYQSQVHPQAIDLGLERLRLVLDRLSWSAPRVPVITVAGTNGKGSVSAYCDAILRAAGLRVGLFTSPHLRDYRERIRLEGSLVGTDALLSAFERIEAARGSVGLTFFEFNTLAALLVFEDAALDAWVLEVGMGGRLDAVNVVDADAAVVVSIGFDHQEYLGSTLAAIAAEKAGIFRKDRAAILGSLEMPPEVERVARSVGARLERMGIEFGFERQGEAWRYHGTRWDLPQLPAPALRGAAQYGNAATAIAALESIDRLSVSPAAISAGLSSVQLTGRFQVIAPARPGAPTWILDVAHNPDAARVLAQNLSALPGSGRTLAVCGILGDKDAPGVVAVLRDAVDAWWCVATDGARGRSAEALAQVIRAEAAASVVARGAVPGVRGAAGGAVLVVAASGLDDACGAALAAAGASDRILVFGSFHIVGPALDWLEAQDLLRAAPLLEYTAAPRATLT